MVEVIVGMVVVIVGDGRVNCYGNRGIIIISGCGQYSCIGYIVTYIVINPNNVYDRGPLLYCTYINMG